MVRNLLVVTAVMCALLFLAGGALAASPGTPGGGKSANSPGSPFHDGVSDGKYAGSQPQNSRNPNSVSQYDVACFQVSQPGHP